MTTKSMFRKSTPSALTLCSRILALFPVSNRMRLPPYSTRAAKPKSMVSEGDLPKASYRMVTRFGVSAAAIPASTRKITARALSEMWRFIGSSVGEDTVVAADIKDGLRLAPTSSGHQDGEARLAQDPSGDATEHPLAQMGVAIGAHDDEVGAESGGLREQ